MNRIIELKKRAAAWRAPELSGPRIVSMTPDGKTGSSVETILRGRIEDLAQAIRDKDIDRLMSFYAADITVFDLRPPLEVRGTDAYRFNFEQWFASFEGPIGFEYHAMRITAGEASAFCHYLALVTGTRPDGRRSGYWVRGTTCFERREGEWLVTHEHISMPMR